jgi:hypothetical protein
MKQLVMTLAAGLVATALMAEVKSVNVVGYTTVTIPSNQWTMIGMQFDQVNDTTGTSVQDVFADPIGTGFKAGGNAGAADNLMFWNTGFGKYVTLYLFDTTATSTVVASRKNKWLNPAAGDIPDTAAWGTAGQPSIYKLKPGEGFWVKRVAGSYGSPITATVKGQVVVGGKSRTMKEGFNQIAGSFTTPFAPNPDVAGTGDAIDWKAMGAAAGGNSGAADNLMFWNTGSGKYVTLYLFDTTATSTVVASRKNKWLNPAAGDIPDTAVWGTAGQPSKYQAPLGNQGFWYKRLAGKGTFNLTEVQPYNLD